MSYDVSVVTDDDVVVFDANYTSNCSGMWADALSLPERRAVDLDGQPRTCLRRGPDGTHVESPLMDRGLRLLNGAPCSEAASFLARAVDRLRAEPDKYRAMNPPNGWGDYETATDFLAGLAAAAQQHPTGRILIHS